MLVVLGRNGQLQHRCGLASDQLLDFQNLPIWEFQRVVLNVRIVHIDLPKACDLVIHTGLAKKPEGAIVLDVVVEGQFRSGQQADRHPGWSVMNYELGTELADGGKTTSTGFRNFHRNELVRDPG